MSDEKKTPLTVAERNRRSREGKVAFTVWLQPHIRDGFHEAAEGLGAPNSTALIRDYINTTIDQWKTKQARLPETGESQTE